MFNAGNTYKGMASSSSGWQPTGDFGCFENYTKRDDVLLTTSNDERTSNLGYAGGVETEEGIESNTDLIWEPRVDCSEIVLFFELESTPTEPKDGVSDGEGTILQNDRKFRDSS
ncbi:hypothetical protein J1N35_041702 [Gossypium stocksii]|uniref:Uncharacterized protein n=1 Tax=Gossypium stocksii TaxID=47602 RepID=A0A9D3ZJY6_9ROSI|nr:hypothetical protein J1N35_041702 [Gossypium stocksii]